MTPSSSWRRIVWRSEKTWKPPESVRIGPSQAMKSWRPPSPAIRSAPGRKCRWYVLQSRISAPSSRSSSGSTALTVALVPTGMNAGVRSSPWAVRSTPARASPSVARTVNDASARKRTPSLLGGVGGPPSLPLRAYLRGAHVSVAHVCRLGDDLSTGRGSLRCPAPALEAHCDEVVHRHLASRFEPLTLVVAPQPVVLGQAVESQEVAAARDDLRIGPVEQPRAETAGGLRPPHRERVHVPQIVRLLAPEPRVAPLQRQGCHRLAAEPHEIEVAPANEPLDALPRKRVVPLPDPAREQPAGRLRQHGDDLVHVPEARAPDVRFAHSSSIASPNE